MGAISVIIFDANSSPSPSPLFPPRVAIVSMHYNKNHGYMQATTAMGERKWAVDFGKVGQREASLSAIKEPPTNGKDRVASELLVASFS